MTMTTCGHTATAAAPTTTPVWTDGAREAKYNIHDLICIDIQPSTKPFRFTSFPFRRLSTRLAWLRSGPPDVHKHNNIKYIHKIRLVYNKPSNKRRATAQANHQQRSKERSWGRRDRLFLYIYHPYDSARSVTLFIRTRIRGVHFAAARPHSRPGKMVHKYA